MRLLKHLIYIPFFWFFFLFTWILTIISRLVFLRFIVKAININNNRVLYLDPFFHENAGTCYRVEKWALLLNNKGISVNVKQVFKKDLFHRYLSVNKDVVLFQAIFIIYRFWQILTSVFYKTVIVRRTILLYNEYGNGNFMEHFLLALHPNVILDFDDDMQIQGHKNQPYSLYGRILIENRRKFYNNLSLYNRFIAGSEYLKTQVLKYNNRVQLKNILVIPTCVDYESHPAKQYDLESEIITFGWIGSVSNLSYLDAIVPVLNRVSYRHPVRLLVISGMDYKNSTACFPIENVAWSLNTEKKELLKIDIGIMPLKNSPMERGKCGFKLIQYMGLGIVSIASGVTINREIIDDKINGFIVNNETQWEEVIYSVIEKRKMWGEIGAKARKKISLKYSFPYYEEDYFSFVTSYSSNYTFKEKLAEIIRNGIYYGMGILIHSFFEKTRDNKKLKPGITAVVSAKNEEVSVYLSLKSLIGFADQIVCIDNGSDDSTLDIMNRFKENYNNDCDITVLSMPDALLGECREMGLKLTKHQWHLRWDADMVFKTTGEESSEELKKIVNKTNRPVAFQLPRVNLYGDFFHTSKFYDVIDRGEPFLIRFSKNIYYKEDGRFDIVKLPLYYRIKRMTNKYIFHCDGIKPNIRLIYRNCYFDWRQKFNNADNSKKEKLKDFGRFKKEWEIQRYGTNDDMSLIYRHQKEYLLHYKKYDPETYSEYPAIILEHLKSGAFRFEILYKNGCPYSRADIKNPQIQSYIPTKEDLLFDPISFLQDILPEKELKKIRTEALCVG